MTGNYKGPIFHLHVSLRSHTSAHSGGESSSATVMLLLPLLLFFRSLLGLLFATQNSALYRYPTDRASFDKFKCFLFLMVRETYIVHGGR